jgi:predicted PhzF superfamily epimerase YddE/YHI9/ribosomal protein S18 acetylase RimI-like enzyme
MATMGGSSGMNHEGADATVAEERVEDATSETEAGAGTEGTGAGAERCSETMPTPFAADGSVRFRQVRPTDIPACYELESSSYPEDEAASKSKLQYRQHHAARYFRCAVLTKNSASGKVRSRDEGEVPGDGDGGCGSPSAGTTIDSANGGDDDDDDRGERELVGFVCATRCRQFRAESMSTHVPDGELLAIHSVVVKREHRRRGLGTAMLKDYLAFVAADAAAETGLFKIVLLAKKELLSYYVDCGFAVTRPSPISHGKDTWYELELDLASQRAAPVDVPPGYYVVDAFASADGECAGNPAAVVVLEEDRDSRWMQRVALEFNLSETAFIKPLASAPPSSDDSNSVDDGEAIAFSIRYFTPTVEVPLCGHATLASAAIVFETVFVRNRAETTVVFRTVDGVELRTNLSVGTATAASTANPAAHPSSHSRKRRPSYRIAMEFPTRPAVAVEDRAWVEDMLRESLQVPPQSVKFAGLSAIGDVLVELTTESFLSIPHQKLNLGAIRSCDHYSRGVIVCCVNRPHEAVGRATTSGDNFGEDEDGGPNSSSGVAPGRPDRADFLSRFFGPKAGIDEDPVTGSAHCVLAPYFGEKLDKDVLVGRQTSVRGGIVECCLLDNRTVQLTGTAVITMNGTLWL